MKPPATGELVFVLKRSGVVADIAGCCILAQTGCIAALGRDD